MTYSETTQRPRKLGDKSFSGRLIKITWGLINFEPRAPISCAIHIDKSFTSDAYMFRVYAIKDINFVEYCFCR